jgi:protease secretion system outer membrane protein
MLNSVKIMSGVCLLAALITAPAMAQSVSPLTSSTQSCLRFEDVLKLSALRDPSVTISKAQESEADAEIKDAKSLFRPQISAFGRSGFGDTGVVDSSISNQIGVRASQRVFDFGDSKYARQAATSGFQASLEDTRQAKLQAAQRTGFSYLELIEAEEQIELTKRRRDYFSQQLSAVDSLLSRGAATRTERASVASQLADADAFVLELNFRREQAITQIQIDTGTSAMLCNPSVTQSVLEQKMARLENPEIAAQIALDKNPGISALSKRADSLEAIRKREKRSRLPIIDVVATGSYSSIGGFDQFAFRDRIGVDISVPLYSGNAIGARNQRASARHAIARGRVLDAERQLRKDVSIGYRRSLSLQSQLLSRQDVEEQTRLQFEAAEIEQKAGAKTLRDLVEIRLEYEQAGFQRIRTKYDLMRQQLQLLTLTARTLN